ncbi:MAG: hypothetical protein ACI4EG_03015 [Fusicatenibacter sp.]
MGKLKISEQWTKTPVDSRIFGNFIESGFGRQVSGMWSEMLYNRAFRDIVGYKKATWEWLGLDESHYGEGAPFWHSGYEEENWKVLGTPNIRHSCGNYTYKGTTSLLVENKKEGERCGLVQEGLHLKRGRGYRFTLTAGVRGNIGNAGLNGFGDTIPSEEKKCLRVRIGGQERTFDLTTSTQKFTWEFTAKETEKGIICLEFSFAGTAIFACASLMPADNLMGWRKDVVDKLKEIAPGVVRFPGGCFVSFYNWESSVGARDCREPMESYYWGGLEENDVGLDEFLQLSELVGFEPQICFNMMTSVPFKARQMVEYLNAPSDVGMGRLRMQNGHEQPYGVKLFEMDNEPGRKWTAHQYAEQCAAFAREMRLADASIEFMMAAYSYDPKLLEGMLEIAGEDIQYVIYRQGNPEFVQEILPVIRSYNEKHGTAIRLANTEWLPSCKSPDPFEDSEVPTDFSWHGEVTNDYKKIFSTQQMSWNYALNGAVRLLDYISYGGEFALANFNNMCNTWGQNVMEATKDSCYLSCMGKVFVFFKQNFVPCRAAAVETKEEGITALAAKGPDGKMQIYLVNRSSEEKELELPHDIECIKANGLRGKGRIYREKVKESCVEVYKPVIKDGILYQKPLSLVCLYF